MLSIPVEDFSKLVTCQDNVMTKAEIRETKFWQYFFLKEKQYGNNL